MALQKAPHLRASRRPASFLVLVLLIALVGSTITVVERVRCGAVAEASTYSVDEYCYSFQVSVTNSTPTNQTDVGVAFTVNSGNLTNQSFMDERALDLKPVTTSLSDVEVMAQDLTLNSARWWVQIPSLPANTNFTFLAYVGHERAKRNQGFFVSGSDTITVSDTAVLDITDDLEVVVNTSTSNTSQDGYFVSKWTANTGYRLGVRASDGQLVAQVDGQIVAAVWDGSLTWLRMTFRNPTLNIDSFSGGTWTNLATLNTGLGAITANAQDLVMGSGYTGILRDVEILDNFGGASYAKVAQWGFAPEDITETSASNPTYAGTVTGEIGGLNATYSLTRDQSNYSAVVGSLITGAADSTITFTPRLKDLLDTPSTTDLFSPRSPASRLPFYSLINAFGTSIGLTSPAWWFLLLAFLGFIAAVAIYKWLGSTDFAYIAVAAILALGPVAGLYDPWVLLVSAVGLIGLWMFTARWARE